MESFHNDSLISLPAINYLYSNALFLQVMGILEKTPIHNDIDSFLYDIL